MSKKVSSREKIEAVELKDKKGIAFEDQLARVFDDVLEAGEKIEKGFKPVKSKMFLSGILTFSIFNVFLVALAIFNLFGEQTSLTETLLGTLIPGGLALIGFVCSIIFTSLRYKNTFYVLTNKRLITRTGVFGVDFNALDIENIGASSVSVSLLDKMLRKNTGTLKFGSNSSPINAEGSTNAYMFMHIQNPYHVHKEIKEYINVAREK